MKTPEMRFVERIARLDLPLSEQELESSIQYYTQAKSAIRLTTKSSAQSEGENSILSDLYKHLFNKFKEAVQKESTKFSIRDRKMYLDAIQYVGAKVYSNTRDLSNWLASQRFEIAEIERSLEYGNESQSVYVSGNYTATSSIASGVSQHNIDPLAFNTPINVRPSQVNATAPTAPEVYPDLLPAYPSHDFQAFTAYSSTSLVHSSYDSQASAPYPDAPPAYSLNDPHASRVSGRTATAPPIARPTDSSGSRRRNGRPKFPSH